MTNIRSEQYTSNDENERLRSNGVFLFFFSAGIAFIVLGLMFDCYVYYIGMQASINQPQYISTDYSQVSAKKVQDWTSGTVKKANKIKSGTLEVNDKLVVTVDDISFCDERVMNPAKLYSQVVYLKYTYKNISVDEPLAVSLDDLNIHDKNGTQVEYYPISGKEPMFKKVSKGEECTVIVPVATINASHDLFISLNMQDSNLKCSKTLQIKMG